MRRRLYYLLPDNRQAAQLAIDLEHNTAIQQQNIHAVARDQMQINGVADVHRMDERDTDATIEWWGWRINLAIFFFSVLAIIDMLVWAPSWWVLIPAGLMLATLAMGLGVALRLPSVHIDAFLPALGNGNILLMVDVGRHQIKDISQYISRNYPAAITGGVCWHR